MRTSEWRSGGAERSGPGEPGTSQARQSPRETTGAYSAQTHGDGQLEITAKEMFGRHKAYMRNIGPYSGEDGLPVTRR